MTSNEERREIAARLRGVTEEELRSMFLGEILDCAIGGRCLDNEGDIDERLILNRLADLIDRPKCRKLIPDEMEGLVFCSNCGAEIGEYGVPNYCHNCGAEVIE